MLDVVIIVNSISAENAPEKICIIPKGLVKSQKGEFLVDSVSFGEMSQKFKARGLDIVVDYEHQTLEGTQAPAAGWIKNIEFTDEGVMAHVDWTSKAKEYLVNKEYRYLSPVILKRKSDNRAVSLHSVALTNTPAIDGMEPIINSSDINLEGEDEIMDLKEIAKMLGLPETVTAEEVAAAIKKLTDTSKSEDQVVANKAILEMLDLKEDAKVEDVKGKIIALKNPAGYVSMEAFNQLKKEIEKGKSTELVEIALKAGKITPAQKEWAEEYALKEPAAFQKFIEKAPQVVPLEQLKYKKEEIVEVNSEVQLSVNKYLGISDEDFKKYGGNK